MGDSKAFLKITREELPRRPVLERKGDYREIHILQDLQFSQRQSRRCMDCRTPFCHWGCPLGNYVPEWNELLSLGKVKEAFQLLSATNNFPEITGRVCPALCEYACCLGINDDPVTIREIELAVVEFAFRNGLVKERLPSQKTGKKVAVIGSGPAGLACADQLNQLGHKVVVFEKNDRIGGILRYGIPDFKLEKWVLDRRIDLLKKEGIVFFTSEEPDISNLSREFEAIVLATGCAVARDLMVEGRDLKGIYLAMEFLTQANRRVLKDYIPQEQLIDARDKKVVVIGGGDTGSDCVGVANRQGAKSITQIELLPCPPKYRNKDYPWPKYPLLFKTSTSHEEGCLRLWSVKTKAFLGDGGWVKGVSCEKLDSKEELVIEADMVILALGFLHPELKGGLENLNLAVDEKGFVKTDKNFMSSRSGVFVCGDMRRGPSLVVWAIAEGRQAASCVHNFLLQQF